jgi:hypothetical protein
LGVIDTVTLGWVTGEHPSYSYHDEMKERLGKLMKEEHKDLQYALLPISFHSITDKNKELKTRGIVIQIMKIPKKQEVVTLWEASTLCQWDAKLIWELLS